MKKIAILLGLVFVCFFTNAQTESGIVYSEHESIDKTRALWQALVDNDEETLLSFFADSIYFSTNGNRGNTVPKENFKNGMTFWSGFKNLKVEDDTPAFPDALKYNDGATIVQDWIKITGIHEETGVSLNLSMHCIYAFNDDGKINMFVRYYDSSVFDDIDYGLTTRENGEVYIYHPYIVETRKLVNAYCAEDLEKVMSFFDPEAYFYDLTMKWGNYRTYEEQKEVIQKRFDEYENIKMEQIGYPDCIYYEESDGYVVYSWWNHVCTLNGNEIEMPLMIALSFNKDGKIAYEMDYFSPNHFEE